MDSMKVVEMAVSTVVLTAVMKGLTTVDASVAAKENPLVASKVDSLADEMVATKAEKRVNSMADYSVALMAMSWAD